MITISRRNFIIGATAVAAIGPTVAQAALAEPWFPLEGNACAEFFINGQQSGPTLPCMLTAIRRDSTDIMWQLDRALDFPCERSGVGYVRFSNLLNRKLWCDLYFNHQQMICVGMTAHVSP
jgi:hypothetical protein